MPTELGRTNTRGASHVVACFRPVRRLDHGTHEDGCASTLHTQDMVVSKAQ